MDAEIHHITCPHCLVGGANVVIDRPGGNGVLVDLRAAHKCDKCKRYFGLKPKLQFIGAPLETTHGG